MIAPGFSSNIKYLVGVAFIPICIIAVYLLGIIAVALYVPTLGWSWVLFGRLGQKLL